MDIKSLNLQQKRAFTLGDKISEQPIALIKNTDLITNKKGDERQIHPGRCYDFAGDNDYINIADHNDFSFGNGTSDYPFSVSAWVNMDVTTWFFIIQKGFDTVGNGEFFIYTSTSSELYFRIKDQSVSSCYLGRQVWNSGSGLSGYVNQWIHITCTYNGLANPDCSGLKIYINGIRSDDSNAFSNASSYVAMENTSQNIYIGSNADTLYSNGKIFDVRIHNKELSAIEVYDIMSGKPSGFEAGWWKMEDGGGNMCYDSSGKGHHGIITNATFSTFHATNTGIPYSFLNNGGYSVCHYFNDTNAYFLLHDSLSGMLDPLTSSFTIETWVLGYDTSDYMEIIHKAANGGGMGWGLAFKTDGKYVFEIYGTTNGRQYSLVSATAKDDGLWHHVMITADASSFVVKMYIDGVLNAQTTLLDWGSLSVDAYFTMGAYYGGSNWFLNGFISGFSFSNTVRSYEEVRQSYYNGFINDEYTIALFDIDSYGTYKDLISGSLRLDNKNAVNVYLPRNESNISKDVVGKPLAYGGTVKYNTQLSSRCADFDGTDDYVSIADHDDFSFGDGAGNDEPFSLSGWVNFDDLDSYCTIICKDNTSTSREWGLGTDNSGGDKIYLNIYKSDGTARIGRYTMICPYAQWVHICGTYDGSKSSSGIKIYLNGMRVDETDNNSGTYAGMSNTAQEVRIGTLGSFETDGKMCDVRVFGSCLTSAEVLNVMNGSAIGTEIAWYPLAEGNGNVVYDVVGGHHGKILNATLSTFWASTQTKFHYNLKGFSDALYFDETAYLSKTYHADFQPNDDPFTIEAIIHAQDYSDGTIGTIYSHIVGSTDRLWLYHSTTGILTLVADNTSSIISATTTSNPFTDNAVHYVAVTVNPGVSIKFYIDGLSVATTVTTNTGGSIDPAGNIYIGCYTTSSHQFKGSIYKVRFSTKERTADDIYNTYINGFVVDNSTIALWDFKNGEGIDIANGHNLTATSTALVKVPVTTDLITDVSGQSVGHVGGSWHNRSETKIDFTGGVSSPMINGIYKGYADFNGTTDYIEITDNGSLSFGDGYNDSAFSLSAWIKMDDATSFPVIGKYTVADNLQWKFSTDSSDKLGLFLYDEVSNQYMVNKSVALTSYENKWTHIAATYNGNAGVPEIIEAASTFEDGGAYEIESVILHNGNIFIVYFDNTNSFYGTFTILDDEGSQVVAPTVFNSDASSYFGLVVLNNGNVYVAFRSGTDPNYTSKFVIISESGSIVTSSTLIPSVADDSDEFKPILLSNGNIFLLYVDVDASYAGKFGIYSESGALVTSPVAFDTYAVLLNPVKLNNGNIFITYHDGSDLDYVIYSQSGSVVKASASIETTVVSDMHCYTLSGGNVLIAYGTDLYGKYAIYGQSGAVVKTPTTFESGGAVYYPHVASLENGNGVIVYQNPVSYYMTSLIVDNDGDIVKSLYNLNTATSYDTYVITLYNGTSALFYSDADNSDYGTVIISDFREAQDADVNDINLYINGINSNDSSIDNGYDVMSLVSSPTSIGYASGSVYANGKIRDLRVYNKELSSDEVKIEFKTGEIIDISYLIAYYKLYKDVKDFSINKLHGVVKGTTNFPKITVPTAYEFGNVLEEPMYKKIINEPMISTTASGALYARNNIAYGIWEFDIYIDSGSSGMEIYFISNKYDYSSPNNCYYFSFASANINLQRFTSGTPTVLASTNTSYFSYKKWYNVKIVRNSETNEYINGAVGTFSIYLDGQIISTSGGSGTMPVTDNNHITSQWITIKGSASGDRIKNFKINDEYLNLSTLTQTASSFKIYGEAEANYTIFERPIIAPAAIRPVHRYVKTE